MPGGAVALSALSFSPLLRAKKDAAPIAHANINSYFIG